MSEIEKALIILKTEIGCAELDISNCGGNIHTEDFIIASKLAIEALQEKAEREKGRECCNDFKSDSVQLKTGKVVTLNYCPMCGRKLAE